MYKTTSLLPLVAEKSPISTFILLVLVKHLNIHFPLVFKIKLNPNNSFVGELLVILHKIFPEDDIEKRILILFRIIMWYPAFHHCVFLLPLGRVQVYVITGTNCLELATVVTIYSVSHEAVSGAVTGLPLSSCLYLKDVN